MHLLVWISNSQFNFVDPCFSYDFGSNIICRNMSTLTVQTAFHNVHQSHFNPVSVIIDPLPDEEDDTVVNIPAEVLGIHCLERIEISCSTYELVVHPDAFRSSGKCTQYLAIGNCYLRSTDFSFLKHFKRLRSLGFNRCAHVNRWSSSEPILANLSDLTISESSDMNNWSQFPNLTGGLYKVEVPFNNIGDVAMERILRWITSFSANTLKELRISNNALTRVPQPLSSFTLLNLLSMSSQKAPGLGSIPVGALHLSSAVQVLYLDDCGITAIERGALQGVH